MTVEATRRVIEMLEGLEQTVTAALMPAVAGEGISRDGWRVLLLLARSGRTMGEIATYTKLPPATATRVVDKLVESGLASRRPDPVDRRRVLVHLAKNGRDVIERVSGQVDRLIGAERAQLVSSLLEALAVKRR
jgi:DNA-binding MarR family transcriptional regulator